MAFISNTNPPPTRFTSQPGTVTAISSSGDEPTIVNDLTVTDTLTVTGVTTHTGAVTLSGGVVGVSTPSVVHSGSAAPVAATSGTDVTPSVTETYIVEVYVPVNTTFTGIAILNGSAVAGNARASMATAAGVPIAAALTASTAQSGTAAYQKIPFAVAWAAIAGKYLILLQFNNTGARFRAHAVGNFGASKKTGETYGTFTTVTAPTTFTADLGPIADLYV